MIETPVSPSTRPRAGRPSREQARLRHEELLDRALEIFLERGFEMTTIDAIAAAVGMTKRTVYARYEDKKALFRATVERAVERWIVPVERLHAAETDDLEETLVAVARIRIRNAFSPVGQRLMRIVNSESYRFPEIFRIAHEQGSQPTIHYLADLFTRHAARGEIVVEDAGIAAAAFLSMVVGGPTRSVVWGSVPGDDEADARMRFCVRLFLNGARAR
ncbi:MAG: TetR/AcrR family transcriptional regulator [Sphingomonas sp.]